MNQDTRPRVAVVTGANRGLGLEVARQLAVKGFTTVLTARSLAKAEAAARTIAERGQVQPAELDITDEESITRFTQWLIDTLGHVDVLVNNAAIGYDTSDVAATVALGHVREVMDTNLFGPWRVTQQLLPLLRQSSHPRVVNVSSEGGSLAGMAGGTPAYSTSKAALNALTRLLSGELRHDNILVNAVCPGWTDTDMGQGGRPVKDGAASIMWAALLSDDGPTGTFTRDGRDLPW